MIAEPIRLLPDHQAPAVDALARAFRDDPLYVYICPDAGRRAKSLRALLNALVDFTLVYGEAWTTPGVDGAACWLPPGRSAISLRQMIPTAFALPLAILRFGPRSLGRFVEVFGYADQAHARAVKGPHWYLWALGVEPAGQGRGIGGSLLQPVLARADAAGLPCYLETETERNVAFYQRRGFEVIEANRVSANGPMLWIMVRQPRHDRSL